MTPLLLATSNVVKVARLRWLLTDLPFAPITPGALPLTAPSIPEDGPDFATNAAQKAQGWSLAVPGMLTMATDGGLDIPALGARWSALRTRRNAGEGADGAAHIRHLLELMRDLHGAARQSYWHEALALARDGALLRTWSTSGDGGLIVEQMLPGAVASAFWTECVRYYPAVSKLYRDLTVEEAQALDLVWPRLREEVQESIQGYT